MIRPRRVFLPPPVCKKGQIPPPPPPWSNNSGPLVTQTLPGGKIVIVKAATLTILGVGIGVVIFIRTDPAWTVTPTMTTNGSHTTFTITAPPGTQYAWFEPFKGSQSWPADFFACPNSFT
jgi:hypothetical protein